MTLEKFKLIAISIDDFTDTQVEQAFLNTEIAGEDGISEVLGVLAKHRPEVLKNLRNKYPSLPTA
jgi:hypothetical protein